MRKLPPLTAIRAFEAAARQRSFTRAAQELCVTVTAISHQIRHLEDHLGIRLFERTARAVTLTDAGERIFPLLCDGFDRLGAAFCELRNDDEAITITTTRAFAERWLVPRLPTFHATFPNVTVHIEATEDVLDLRSARADLAIRYGNPPTGGDRGAVLFQDAYFAVASPALLGNGEAGLAAFEGRPLLAYKWKSLMLGAPDWQAWLTRNAIRSTGSLRFTWFSEETLALHAAERGMGPVLCSGSMIVDQLAAGKLRVLVGEPLPGFSFHIVERPSIRRRKSLNRFVAWLRDEAATFSLASRRLTPMPRAA